MVINTGIYCADGGTVSLSGVAIGDGATVIITHDQDETTVIVTDDQE
jgi:hypothetical protein